MQVELGVLMLKQKLLSMIDIDNMRSIYLN